MKRVLLTCSLVFSLLPVHAGEGRNLSAGDGKKGLPVDYVDPFIGTTNFGTTNPGAVCPNGMMSVVPFNVMGSSEIRTIKTPVGGLLLMNIPIVFLRDMLM